MCSSYLLLLAFTLSAAQQFTVPDFNLQADKNGDFRAYLPDDCGYDKVKFDWRKENENQWQGERSVSGPEGGLWVFPYPAVFLAPGEPIVYAASLYYNGELFKRPETPWSVPELVEEFAPPPPGMCQNETSTTPRSQAQVSAKNTTNPGNSTGSNSTEEGKLTNKPKDEPNEKETRREDWRPPQGVCGSPWLLEPAQGDPRDVKLEKQLERMRCELMRYSLLSAAINQELTDLKKLNYAMVARMQRLEAILRAGPFPPPWA